MKALARILIVVVLLTSVVFQCAREPKIVAKVDTMPIPLEELRRAIIDQYKTRDLNKVPPAVRKKILNNLIDERLLAKKAIEVGLDKDPEFVQEYQAYRQRILATNLYDEEIIDKAVPDALAKKYLRWMQYNVKGYVIVVGYKGSFAYHGDRSKEEARKRAEEVRQKLQEGVPAEELVLRYSDDYATRQKKGQFLSYPIGQYSPEVDEAVLTSHANAIVGPLDSRKGFLIFKITEFAPRTNQLKLDIDLKLIKRRLANTYFSQKTRELFQKFNDEIRKRFHVEIKKENLTKFAQIIQNKSKGRQSLENLTPEEAGLVLATYDGGQVTVGDLIDAYKNNLREVLYGFSNPRMGQRSIQNHLNMIFWTRIAEEKGIPDKPEVKLELTHFYYSKLAQYLEKKYLQPKIQVTDEEVKDYYEKHKNDYARSDQIELWVISTKDKKVADKLYQRVQNGEDFAKLAAQFNERQDIKRWNGYLKYQSRKSIFGSVVMRAFELGPNKVGGVYHIRQYYYIIKTGGYKPKKFRPLEEVEKSIRATLRQRKLEKAKEQLIQELRRNTYLYINDTLLRNLV